MSHLIHLRGKRQMHRWLFHLVVAGICLPAIFHNGPDAYAAEDADQTLDVLVVVGAAGEKEFGDAFARTAELWKTTCQRAGLNHEQIGPETPADESARDRLQSTLRSAVQIESVRPLWLILVGHGTWDGTTADFNLVGPDISAKELAESIQNAKRQLVVINTASSSAPFIDRLAGPNRIIVTATKSGSEQNYTRFGEYFAAALGALDADLDHDDSISVREAFLKAASDTDRFYQEQGRLSTEHALIEDNNDRKGSSPALVIGTAKSKSGGKVDGGNAARVTIPATTEAVRLTDEQITLRDSLETQLREIIAAHDDEDKSALRKEALPILLELPKLYSEPPPAAETTQPQTPTD